MPSDELIALGSREWVRLPDFGIPAIKAKVDTGARTSALHAFDVREFSESGARRVEVKIHPRQRDTKTVTTCIANVIDRRLVTDSGGHKEERWVISSALALAGEQWPIEFTLTARDDMLFRMLIGRTAINGKAVVDPSRSYVVGKKPGKRKRTKSS